MGSGWDTEEIAGNRAKGYFFPLSLAMYSISITISLSAFVYGATLAYLQPRIWQDYILRMMIVAQFFNCLFFAFRLVLVDAELETEAACRVAFFMSDSFSLLPVNICVHCVVYLQLVVVHNVSPGLRWPRVVTLVIALAITFLPVSFILFIAPRRFGRRSICDLNWVPNDKEYSYYMTVLASWAYLSGAIGFVSVLTIAIYLVRTRRATLRALQLSAAYYGPSLAVERVGHSEILYKALLTIIWVPITPIISLWFNTVLVTVSHYKHRIYNSLEIINLVLLCLQAVFLGLPLLVNPRMRAALAAQLRGHQSPVPIDTTCPPMLLPPPAAQRGNGSLAPCSAVPLRSTRRTL